MKYVFLYGSNNSESVVFRNASFEEIKDFSLRRTPFQKNFFAMKVLTMCLPYLIRYFYKQQLSAFFFIAQITQIEGHRLITTTGMPVLKRSKITV